MTSIPQVGNDALWRVSQLYRDLPIDAFDLFSIDVFDTTLHRACRRPTDLFIEVGRRAAERGWLDAAIDPNSFGLLREQMEQNARRRGRPGRSSGEVTLAEIWAEAPAFLGPPEQMMALEEETELELSIANPYTISFVRELRRRGRLICFLSDSYLEGRFIARLLAKARLERTDYDDLFVSCEHDRSKTLGTIFPILRKRFAAVRPSRILHIGDDISGDVIQPARSGLQTRHFHFIHPGPTVAERETLAGLDLKPDPLAAVRWLGRAAQPYEAGDEAFFFEFGAAVLGPPLAAFCAWVAHDAARRGITQICAIMREGALLARLLRQAVSRIGAGIAVEELYTSRRAAFLPAVAELDATALAHYRRRRNFTLGDLIAERSLPAPPDAVAPFLGVPLEELPTPASVTAYLQAPATQTAAREASAAARTLFIDYLQSIFTPHAKIALVDFGAAGNVMRWTADCLGPGAQTELVNYLFYAVPDLIPNLASGHLYVQHFPPDPETVRLSRVIHRTPEIFETLLTGLHETTLGYRRDPSGAVVPITGRMEGSVAQSHLLRAFEAGAETAAAHLAHALSCAPEDLLLSAAARSASLRCLCRVLDLPTADEARLLGALHFDDNAGTDHIEPIFRDADVEMLRTLGAASFLGMAKRRWGYKASGGVRWPQGVVAATEPEAIVQLYRRTFNDVDNRFFCTDLVDRALSAGLQAVTVYGGGKIGYDMLEQAERRGLKVDFVVDSNPALHGIEVRGRLIVSLETAAARGCHAYIVASMAFASAIADTIRSHYRDRGARPPVILAGLDD